VGDVVFVGYGGDGALGVFAAESFVEEDEVGEAAADGGVGGLEGAEVGLHILVRGARVVVSFECLRLLTLVVTRYET